MFKKIFNELFSSDAAQPESPTHTASASLSADALHDLEARKRAIVADITRLAAELSECPDLGAPVGGAPIGVGTLAGGPALAASCANPGAWQVPTLARPTTLAEAAEYLARQKGAKP